MRNQKDCLGSENGEVGSLLIARHSEDLALITNWGNGCCCCGWLWWCKVFAFLDCRSLADWPTSSTAEWIEFITIAARRFPDGIGLRLRPFCSTETLPPLTPWVLSLCGLGGVIGFSSVPEADDGDLEWKLCDERSIGLLLRRKSPPRLDGDDVSEVCVLLFSDEAAERLRPGKETPTCLRTGLGLWSGRRKPSTMLAAISTVVAQTGLVHLRRNADNSAPKSDDSTCPAFEEWDDDDSGGSISTPTAAGSECRFNPAVFMSFSSVCRLATAGRECWWWWCRLRWNMAAASSSSAPFFFLLFSSYNLFFGFSSSRNKPVGRVCRLIANVGNQSSGRGGRQRANASVPPTLADFIPFAEEREPTHNTLNYYFLFWYFFFFLSPFTSFLILLPKSNDSIANTHWSIRFCFILTTANFWFGLLFLYSTVSDVNFYFLPAGW